MKRNEMKGTYIEKRSRIVFIVKRIITRLQAQHHQIEQKNFKYLALYYYFFFLSFHFFLLRHS